jgi:cytochrome c-type biogenesis protein CcmH/NrfG
MTRLQDIPGWIQAFVLIVVTLIGAAVAFGSLQAAQSLETAERKAADQQLQQEDQHFKESVTEIKQLLRDESDRHHPRR